LFALLFSTSLYAQSTDTNAVLKRDIQDTNRMLKKKEIRHGDLDSNLKTNRVPVDTNSKKILVKDTTAHIYNMYRGLLKDDPIYNKKDPLWEPIVKIATQNVLLNLFDHYLMHYDWAVVGFRSWNNTLIRSGFPWNKGWNWEEGRFGNSLFLHPYGGASYFNSARAGGYDFWESSLFTLGGSYTWKLFCENGEPQGRPERQALINTTLGGMFGGEVLYRLSSNVIDERTTGSERVGREILAFFIDPSRAITRLFNGKMFAHNTVEVYEKEPLDIVVSTGGLLVNDASRGSALLGVIANFDFDYGNPFELRDRKPYDYFQLRTDFTLGQGRKFVDNVIGYGALAGSNTKIDGVDMLIGAFQSFDFWDSKEFELGTNSFGAGAVTKLTVTKNVNLYTNLNIGIIPFGENSGQHGPDTSQIRDYNFVGGAQSKLDMTLNVEGVFSASMLAYYYWLNTFVPVSTGDNTANNFIAILKPRIEVRLFNNIGVGFEHRIYFENRVMHTSADIHKVATQEKLFLTIYLADFLHNK
jgi:hypothetical protein